MNYAHQLLQIDVCALDCSASPSATESQPRSSSSQARQARVSGASLRTPHSQAWRRVPWQLRPPHVSGRHKHHGLYPVPGAHGLSHSCADASPGVQPHRDDQEVRPHLGHRGHRRGGIWRQARSLRNSSRRHVHLWRGHHLQGW